MKRSIACSLLLCGQSLGISAILIASSAAAETSASGITTFSAESATPTASNSAPNVLLPGAIYTIQENSAVLVPDGASVTSPNQNVTTFESGSSLNITLPGAVVTVPVSATGKATHLITTNRNAYIRPVCSPFTEKNQTQKFGNQPNLISSEYQEEAPNKTERYAGCLSQPNAACLFEELMLSHALNGKKISNQTALFNWARQTMRPILEKLGCTIPVADSGAALVQNAENEAVALAKAGHTEAALVLADRVFPVENSSDFPQTNIADQFKSADENTQKRYLMALLGLAEGRIKHGDNMSARQTLAEIERLTAGELGRVDRFYGEASMHLAMRVAMAFAELGDAKHAVQAANKIPKSLLMPDGSKVQSFPDEDLANVAVSLCQANQKAAGRRLLSYARVRKHASEFDLTSLARVEMACENTAKAKIRFSKAVKLAEAVPYKIGHLAGLTDMARRQVREDMLYAGLTEPFWQQEAYDIPDFMLRVERQRALDGNAEQVLEKLDAMPTVAANIQPTFSLIRAQVLGLLGRESDAEIELEHAKSLARSNGFGRRFEKYNSGRAWGWRDEHATGLLEVAELYLQLHQPNSALTVTREALAEMLNRQIGNATAGGKDSTYRSSLFWPQFDYSQFVKLLAETGADQEAQNLSAAAFEPIPNHLAQQIARKNTRSRVIAEIALSRYRTSGDSNDLQAINNVQPARARLALWRVALDSANPQNSFELTSLLMEEIQRLPEAFVGGVSNYDLRRQVRDFGYLLRSDRLNLTEADKILAVRQLAEVVQRLPHRVPNDMDSPKAWCELGFVAKKLNLPEYAKLYFDEGLTVTAELNVHSNRSYIDEINPTSIGACAFWLKAAGEQEAASAVLQKYLQEFVVKQPVAINLGNSLLLDLALVYGEYEYGEVQWQDGMILAPLN